MDLFEAEILFPPRAIPALHNERGIIWQELVNSVENSGTGSPEELAFILLMARLNNCNTCNANSYRAGSGCITCTRQMLKRFHQTDVDLLACFQATITEVDAYLHENNS
jgi:hypothetical protein